MGTPFSLLNLWSSLHWIEGFCIYKLNKFPRVTLPYCRSRRDDFLPYSAPAKYPRCLDPDTNFLWVRQCSHCSCYTKRPLDTVYNHNIINQTIMLQYLQIWHSRLSRRPCLTKNLYFFLVLKTSTQWQHTGTHSRIHAS